MELNSVFLTSSSVYVRLPVPARLWLKLVARGLAAKINTPHWAGAGGTDHIMAVGTGVADSQVQDIVY